LIWANDFDGSIEFEDKTFEGMLSPRHSMVDIGVTFLLHITQKLLLCNLQLTRDYLDGRFLLPWGREGSRSLIWRG
jgi:hypothetical protein